MKKTYKAPNQTVVKIQTTRQMLAGYLSGTLDQTQTITDSDDFGARSNDFDED